MLSTSLIKILKWGGRRIADLIAIAVVVVIGLFFYSQYPSVWVAAGFSAFLFAMYLCRYIDSTDVAPAPPLETVSNNFGSASYAGEQAFIDNPEGLGKGVFFGMSSDPDRFTGRGAPIFSKPENHTLIVAKTGTGKGTRIIVPTLIRAMKTSAFVIDPKGENAAITARARALHNNVIIMDPWRELGDTYQRLGFPPATFNPLDILNVKDPNCVALAQSMGDSMSPSVGQREPFWAKSAANIIAAVLLWLTDNEGLVLFADAPPEEKTLARLSDILNRDRKSFTRDYVSKMAASQGPPQFGGAIRRLASPFLDMPDTTYGGVMGHIAQATSFLTDPQIQAATKTSSFSLADLTGAGEDRPTTLYLVVPWDRIDIQKTWLRLMITSGMHIFKHKPPGAKYRCMFLIDEFPALGKLDDMPRDIATMRSAGVDFVLAVQSLTQIRDEYGPAADNIIGNCSYKYFCNVTDLPSAEYLSKTLGKKTIRIKNKGESSGESFGGQGHRSKSEGESVSYSETGRELLTPDEVIHLGTNAAILLAPNTRPHYLRPVDYWNLQDAFEGFQKKYPDLFWPLYYDRNAALSSSIPQCTPQPPETAQRPAGGTPLPAKSAYDPTVYAPENAPRPTRTAPAGKQTKPPATPPSNYDPGYYSPDRIAERAAAEKPGDGSEQSKPSPAPQSNYDPEYYSPQRIAERAAAKNPAADG